MPRQAVARLPWQGVAANALLVSTLVCLVSGQIADTSIAATAPATTSQQQLPSSSTFLATAVGTMTTTPTTTTTTPTTTTTTTTTTTAVAVATSGGPRTTVAMPWPTTHSSTEKGMTNSLTFPSTQRDNSSSASLSATTSDATASFSNFTTTEATLTTTSLVCEYGSEATWTVVPGLGSGAAVWACAACEKGYFQPSNTQVNPKCKKHTNITCAAGSGVKLGTAITDSACDRCPAGYFQPRANAAAPCHPWTVAEWECTGDYVWVEGTNERNSACVIDAETTTTTRGYYCTRSCMNSTCDALSGQSGVSCLGLEDVVGCDCTGCQCPLDQTTTSTGTTSPSRVPSTTGLESTFVELTTAKAATEPPTAKSSPAQFTFAPLSTVASSANVTTASPAGSTVGQLTRETSASSSGVPATTASTSLHITVTSVHAKSTGEVTSDTSPPQSTVRVRPVTHSERCNVCEHDYSEYGSECCDLATWMYGVSCEQLEARYNWNCAGCACTQDDLTLGTATDEVTTMPSVLLTTSDSELRSESTQGACEADCFEATCDWWHEVHGVTCHSLEIHFDCACTGCGCGMDTSTGPAATEFMTMVPQCPTSCFGFTCDEQSVRSNVSCHALSQLFGCDCDGCPCITDADVSQAPQHSLTSARITDQRSTQEFESTLHNFRTELSVGVVPHTTFTPSQATSGVVTLSTSGAGVEPGPSPSPRGAASNDGNSSDDVQEGLSPMISGVIAGVTAAVVVAVITGIVVVVIRRQKKKLRTGVGLTRLGKSHFPGSRSVGDENDSEQIGLSSKHGHRRRAGSHSDRDSQTSGASDMSENEERLNDPWTYIRATQDAIMKRSLQRPAPEHRSDKSGNLKPASARTSAWVSSGEVSADDAPTGTQDWRRRGNPNIFGDGDDSASDGATDLIHSRFKNSEAAHRPVSGSRPRRRLRRRRRLGMLRRANRSYSHSSIINVDEPDGGGQLGGVDDASAGSDSDAISRSRMSRSRTVPSLGLDSDLSADDDVVKSTAKRWRQKYVPSSPRPGSGIIGTPRVQRKKKVNRFSPIVAEHITDTEMGPEHSVADSREGDVADAGGDTDSKVDPGIPRSAGAAPARPSNADLIAQMPVQCSAEAVQHAQHLLGLGACSIADMQSSVSALLPADVDRELVLDWLLAVLKVQKGAGFSSRRFALQVVGNLRMWAQCWEDPTDGVFQALQEHARAQLERAAALERARSSYEANTFKVLGELQGYTACSSYEQHVTDQFRDGGVPAPDWPWSMENEYCCATTMLYLGHAIRPTVFQMLRHLCTGTSSTLRVVSVMRFVAAAMEVGLLHQEEAEELSPENPRRDSYLASQLDNVVRCEIACATTQDMVDMTEALADVLGDPIKLFNGLHPKLMGDGMRGAADQRCVRAQYRFSPHNTTWGDLISDLVSICS
eukprot:INCI7009.4.p1 GENE.INCI7009.4~~INCI7009.4.p1  ORF type:complete len:1417 (+),score=216.64 INCI7009.4:277-4527(+)